MKSNIPIRMRAGTNPGGRGHDWVKKKFILGDVPFIPSSYLDNIYLDVNVISTKNNPYIIFCQKKECNFENAYLISNMRELEHSLFIKKNYLLNNVGYIHIFSYEDSITGKVIFKDFIIQMIIMKI